MKQRIKLLYTLKIQNCEIDCVVIGLNLYTLEAILQFLSLSGPRSAVGSASDSRARGLGFDTRSSHILSFLFPLIQEGQLSVTGESMCTKYWLVNRKAMIRNSYNHIQHPTLSNRLGGLSLPRKSVVRLTDHPDPT